MHILIVEDEVKIAEYLAKGLNESGYSTTIAENGVRALSCLQQQSFDLVLLDVMLPDLDGWQVLHTLRTFSQIPVLMLTARDHVLDRVKGLELGADDYLTKPFSYIELLARIKSLLRRVPRLEQEAYQVSDLVLNRLKHEVYRNGQKIDLSQKEFALLQLLMEHQGQVMTRSQIASMVWNINFNTDTNVVDVAIRRLRSKIDDHYTPKLIHTVRGMGYKLDEYP
ncbi:MULTISPECIES: heavy metal response regulator transcription factor [Acinetobacter]|jgi:two-component system copper resistance phosphate regulon response regulator CusR|uniref:Two-component system copper resistance phosphate regulon response regulator CusR n=3 Tax=Acinetobacter TaxID=469 RepID=A0AAW8LLW1_ACILW|nr:MULTISPECIES: heavy metal response regulator transcription factor [Acinetobacter]MBA4069443.1 DNA-binding response regulator [Acinetobacter sp.]RDC51838.1 response regulator [Acinetobacter sp. RIT592]MBB6364008.1 two-component system copper resistance phosphate regulon response regulator CusR [Acinetobacter lwoffii]MCO8115274.1 heavy metal response regulator transcription factor [Acinetobacter lwoffii]MDR6630540.1 two-component system copper resistance phosphate regulon response regulator C